MFEIKYNFFNFEKSLNGYGWLNSKNKLFFNNVLYVAFSFNEKKYLIEIKNDENILFFNFLEGEENKEVYNFLKHVFNTEWNIENFFNYVKQNHPNFYKNFLEIKGARLFSSFSVEEAVITAISEQQISMKAALKIREKFLNSVNDGYFKIKNEKIFLFPNYKTILGNDVEFIKKAGFSKTKAEAILKSMEKIKNGKNDFINIKGIGPWTQKYIEIRTTLDENTFPLKDYGLKTAFEKFGINNYEKFLNKVKFPGIFAFYTMVSM
jgi:3-methyladenine DNA glycosylase/8-oxoguanine DNA glycosylase